MPVCPLDYRYGTPEMKAIFTEDRRIDYLLRIEGALAMAHEDLGNIPPGTGKSINEKASVEHVSAARVNEIERRTKHDIMALTHALSEAVGESGSAYIHLGATSSDILDSATAIQIREANSIILSRVAEIARELSELALKTEGTICIGRTHGQHAIPMTFGFKVGVWALEMRRHQTRLLELRPRVEVGKMSGAVGTGAAFGGNSIELEKKTMKILGLGIEEISTQVVQRDRYVELINFIANLATTLEKIATEIRNLQRTEINEIREHFDDSDQVGSSTMAQKVNPITCENVCGLARIIRSLVIPTMENALLWHERDLANSSAERFLIPHSYVLLDDILEKMSGVITGLSVNEQAMMDNIEMSQGLCMAESVMMAMTRKGVSREHAHEIIRKISMESRNEKIHLREALVRNSEIRDLFSEGELREILDPRSYLGHIRKKIAKYIEPLPER